MTMDDNNRPDAPPAAEPAETADPPRADGPAQSPDDPDRILWEGSASLRLVLPPVAVVVVAYVLVALLQVVFGADPPAQTVSLATAVIIGLGVAGWFGAVQRARLYQVTASAITVRSGVFDRVTEHVDLVHFREAFVDQTPLGRILGCGDVEVITGNLASEQVCFAGVRDPLAVREIVLRAVEDFRTRTPGGGEAR